jgi:hypothetical protein
MRVVSMISLHQVRELESALAGMAELIHCASERECASLVRQHRPHVLIVDPALLEKPALFELVRSENQKGLAIVLYTSFSLADVIPALHAMARLDAEMLLADVDDTDSHVRELLLRIPARAAQAELFRRVAGRLIDLPPRVAAVLAGILLDPRSRTLKQLPQRLGIGRRTIDRSLELAEYPALNAWYSVARLARAFEVVRAGDVLGIEAAAAAGYGSVRSLRDCARRFLGAEPQAFTTWTLDAFVERAARALLAGHTASAPGRDLAPDPAIRRRR